MADALTRRRVVELGLALPPVAVLAAAADELLAAAAAGPLQVTPSCDDGDEDPTEAQTEGPYFTPRSPRRRSIVPAGAAGTRLALTGRVLSRSCRPVARALVDVWQADARGAYDTTGYRFRGHQLTDAAGRYSLQTVVPGLYPGRTRHIHVKVQAPGRPVLTTQLYFPGVARNRTDGIFDPSLVVRGWRTVGGRRAARFDFVLTSTELTVAAFDRHTARVATVLIAEDNADLRELCRTHLEADGFAVLEATTGTEALEVARRERPAVVLLDVVMPGLDGLRVAEVLRSELGDDVRIVFISGRGRFEEQLEGLERGAVDYVTKPFDPAQLVARVRSLLDPEGG